MKVLKINFVTCFPVYKEMWLYTHRNCEENLHSNINVIDVHETLKGELARIQVAKSEGSIYIKISVLTLNTQSTKKTVKPQVLHSVIKRLYDIYLHVRFPDVPIKSRPRKRLCTTFKKRIPNLEWNDRKATELLIKKQILFHSNHKCHTAASHEKITIYISNQKTKA